MKNLYGVLVLCLMSLVISPVVNAQEKSSKAKKVTEEEIIRIQKMEELEKKSGELGKAMDRVVAGYPMRSDTLGIYYYDISVEKIREARDAARDAYEMQDNLAVLQEQMRAYTTTGVQFHGAPGNSSSLQYSKQLDKSSFKSDYSFQIDSDAKRASIAISGHCTSGEIRITVTTPDGKLYTEVLIDDMGSVNWRKSFNLENENSNKAGSWNFAIAAKEATGTFRLSLSSN